MNALYALCVVCKLRFFRHENMFLNYTCNLRVNSHNYGFLAKIHTCLSVDFKSQSNSFFRVFDTEGVEIFGIEGANIM